MRWVAANHRLRTSLIAVLLAAACAPAARATPPATMPSGLATSPTPIATPIAAPTAVVATPSPIPATAGVTPTAEGWRAVPEQASVRGIQFHDVVWTGTRFVAVGEALDGGGAFLDSPDGLAWHRQTGPGAGTSPARLAARPRGVVAVGSIGDRPASWFSSDGLTWTAQAGAFPVPATGSDMVAVTDVVATPEGWLAVGREDPPCTTNCGFSPVRALAWTSPDGLRWARVSDQASLVGGGMGSVVRGDAVFVAGGVASRHAAIWTSSDGSTWLRVPDDAAFHPQSDTDGMAWSAAGGVAARPGVVVVVGSALGVGPGGAPSALAWCSADGRTWAPASVEDPIPDYGSSVATVADGFLATGSAWRDEWRRVVWSSTNGRTWRVLSSGLLPDGFDPAAVADSPTIEVAVGAPYADQGVPGAIWWRAIPQEPA